MAHDPDRVGVGTLGDTCTCSPVPTGRSTSPELMQAFNISSVKAQASWTGSVTVARGSKVDDLIEAMEEYATGASPKMLTNTKLDEALRDIYGRGEDAFRQLRRRNGRSMRTVPQPPGGILPVPRARPSRPEPHRSVLQGYRRC